MKLNKKKRDNIYGYLFLSIWIIGFLVFTIYPILETFYLSFNEVVVSATGIETKFIKLENYKNIIFKDMVYVNLLIKFIGEIILQVPIIISFSLIIAIILNMKLKGKGILRTIFFLPVIIVSGPVMKEFISSGATEIKGLENITFIKEGLDMLPLLFSNILYNLINSFIMILWFSGVQILIFLSALQKMDKPVYEAAYVDGASKWESFWKITLPNLKPMVVINIVYTIVFIATFSLNDVIILIQESSFSATAGLGIASAMSFIYFILIVFIILIFVRIYVGKNKRK